jgi:hypothetical protein
MQTAELLQLMLDVFGHMDSAMNVDVREVERELLVTRIFSFLNILKYQMPTEEEEKQHMMVGLAEGEKHVIYPILHWCLHKFQSLQKRAYLAKYLVPEPIPQEFMQV